ncbi:MAG: hypothetical protein ACJ764_13515 [Solirubrobacteraceae bacterium]
MTRRLVALLALLAGLGALPATATAARKQLVYRTRGYSPPAKPPKRAPPKPHDVRIGSGHHPSLLVDEAGFAHAVWAEDRSGSAQASVLRYCRIPRGGRACDIQRALVPPGGQYSTDYGGPKIVQIGAQLVVMTTRYPGVVMHPDGTSTSTTVWEWTSADGGRTWTGPAQLGKEDINGGAVAWNRHLPTITTITDTVTGGTFAQTTRAGGFADHFANLAVGPDQAYAGSLAVVRDRPVAAFSGLDGTSYVRSYKGRGDPNNPASWTAPKVFPDAEDVRLGAGPLGTFLLYRKRSDGGFFVRELGSNARPVRLNTGGNYRNFYEDRGGLLHAVFSVQDIDGLHVIQQTSTDGRVWTAPERLYTSTTDGANDKDVSAASDGGGFVIWMVPPHTGQNGPIRIASIGTLAKASGQGAGSIDSTGKPSTGYQPGISFECQKIAFGAVTVLSEAGCFLHDPNDPNGSAGVTIGPIRFNGLDIIPDANAQIVIDPVGHHLNTYGDVTVELRGVGDPIKLYHGQLNVDIPAAGPGARLFTFDTSKFGVDLKGFPALGKIEVFLEKDSVRIPVSLGLPPPLNVVSGEAVLRASNDHGLHLDSMGIHIRNVFVGPLQIERIDIAYSQGEGGAAVWEGSGLLRFPGAGALEVKSVRFVGGKFNHAGISVEPPPPGILIAPFTYLTQIGGDFGLDPTFIGADATIGAGAAVNGVSPVSVQGRLEAEFGKIFRLELKGEGRLFVLHLLSAFIRYESDGWVEFGGDAGLDLKVVSVHGDIEGAIDANTGRFGAAGKVRVCPLDLSVGPFSFPCLTVAGAANNEGFAACVSAHFDFPVNKTISGGLELPWSALTSAELLNPTLAAVVIAKHVQIPCNTKKYQPPAHPARAAAAGVVIHVPAGAPSATVLLFGRDGPPDANVTGPGGKAVKAILVRSKPARATWVVLTNPPPGTYTVHSPDAVNQALTSTGYRPLVLHARLRKRGRQRSIVYRIAHAGARQTVTFVETGAFGQRVLGHAKGTSGTLRFRPAHAQGGRRTVIALIGRAGFASRTQRIGRYRAHSPRGPARVASLHVRRKGTKVVLHWGRAARAAQYVVSFHDTSGLRLVQTLKRRSLVLRAVPREAAVVVTVRGVDHAGHQGRPRTGRLRAAGRSPVVYSRR